MNDRIFDLPLTINLDRLADPESARNEVESLSYRLAAALFEAGAEYNVRADGSRVYTGNGHHVAQEVAAMAGAVWAERCAFTSAEGRRPQGVLMSTPLAPHQQRVVDELGEVDAFIATTKERVEKLGVFIASPKFEGIVADEAERDRLIIQHGRMLDALNSVGMYRASLDERIAAF